MSHYYLTNSLVMAVGVLAVMLVLGLMGFLYKLVRDTRRENAQLALAALVLMDNVGVERSKVFHTFIISKVKFA